jgi:hypothetical protein
MLLGDRPQELLHNIPSLLLLQKRINRASHSASTTPRYVRVSGKRSSGISAASVA